MPKVMRLAQGRAACAVAPLAAEPEPFCVASAEVSRLALCRWLSLVLVLGTSPVNCFRGGFRHLAPAGCMPDTLQGRRAGSPLVRPLSQGVLEGQSWDTHPRPTVSEGGAGSRLSDFPGSVHLLCQGSEELPLPPTSRHKLGTSQRWTAWLVPIKITNAHGHISENSTSGR